MGCIEDAIRLSWVSGLHKLTGKPPASLKDWIAKKNYAVSSVSAQGFRISPFSHPEIIQAIGYDINRMAVASFESVAHAKVMDDLPRSLAWVAVKLYYSAFYSANALLRVSGSIPTYLEGIDIVKIKSMAFGLDVSGVKSGEYVASYSGGLLEFVKSDKRSHEVVWWEFAKYLKDAVAVYKASGAIDEDKEALSVTFNALVACLEQANCQNGNWLSHVRNRINYRHDYGVWFPYDKEVDYRKIGEMIVKTLNLSPSDIILEPTGCLSSFIKSCIFIHLLCRLAIFDISARCPKGRSFLKGGAIDFMKIARVA